MAYRTSLANQIEARIHEHINKPDAHFRVLAQRLEALPIYADMGGNILIRPDGELLFVSIDEDEDNPGVVTSLIEPKWRTIALVVGSEKYPELRELLPSRPLNAQDCQHCGGRGRIDPLPEIKGILCGYCDALGWIPRE